MLPCYSCLKGWSNKLSGEVTTPTAYPIIVGGGLDCTKGSYVGSVSISCTNTNGGSTVTLGSLDQQIIGTGLEQHMYLGCARNND